MQLNAKRRGRILRAGLMAATCALLAPALKAQTPAAGEVGATQIDTGLLYYQEDKGRVRSIDAIVKLNRDFGDERVLGVTAGGGQPHRRLAQRRHGAQSACRPSPRPRATR